MGQVESPLYWAMMVWCPPVNAPVLNVARPPETVPLPGSAAPSENCTLPVGGPAAGDPPLVPMAAVKVTACLSDDGFTLLVGDSDDVAGG
ncbi:MAG: hypothetical protein ABSH56_25725 [Bryobacteraceae bacterium]